MTTKTKTELANKIKALDKNPNSKEYKKAVNEYVHFIIYDKLGKLK